METLGELFNIFNKPEYITRPGIRLRPIYYTDVFMTILFIIEDEVPSHRHLSIQFGLILDGEAVFKIGDREFKVSGNTFYYIPSNVEHSVKVLKKPLYALDFFIPPREDYVKYFRNRDSL